MSQVPLAGRFTDAVHYAAVAHHGHLRKGTEIPYLSHLLSVAALVLEHGGTELQATAGLLHDVVEDCGGAPRLEDVRRTFGEEVAELVAALSDSFTEEGEEKDEWRPRKEAYLRHLENMVANEHPATLVSLCDKLHNARAIVADAADEQDGPGTEIWSRFTGGVDGTVWYYRELVRIFETSQLPRRAVQYFSDTVDELARHADVASGAIGSSDMHQRGREGSEEEQSLEYESMSGTDGDRQLIARDPEARWIVIEQHGTGRPKVLKEEEAEGKSPYYAGLLGNPAWYPTWSDTRKLYIFAEGRSSPDVIA